MKNNKQNSGFTLIELLVVVAIIGMLLSVISLSFTNSRIKARDTKRLAEMSEIKNGLELYYLNSQGYPDQTDWNLAQLNNTVLQCNGSPALRVPNDVSGFTYTYVAGGTSYPGCGSTVWSEYYVSFQTEGHTELGPGGSTYYMTPRGFTDTAPF